MHNYLQRIETRIKSMILRAVLYAVSDDSAFQTVKIEVFKGEVKEDVERVQNFGHSSHPPKGSRCVVLFASGNRDHPIVIAAEDPNTRHKDLKEGESVQYNATGQFILIRNDGTIEIQADGQILMKADNIRCETAQFECTGEIKDRVDSDGKSMSEMRGTYDGHTHTGDDGGNTSDPHQPMGGGS